jgi:tetratricopeptide (TPR) repeat protein
VKSRFLTAAALAFMALAGSAHGQRIGIYPLESTDTVLALAVPTAVQRSLETIDGVVIPAPRDLYVAVQQRPTFFETLDKVFSLETLITGKLEGSTGSYSISYTMKRGAETKSFAVKGADFAALVVQSNNSIKSALLLKPTTADASQLAAVERSLPSAEVVTASAEIGAAGSTAILEKAGSNPWAVAARALLLVGANKNDEALALITPAAKIAVNDPFVQAVQIIALLATRKNPEAKTALEATFKLNPAKPEIHYLNARHILRSSPSLTQEVVQKALDALQLALQYNPRYLEAAQTAADVLEQYGNAERAIGVLTALVARMPDEPGLHNRILDTLLELDRESAVTYLQEVIQTFPDVSDTIYSLALRLFDTEAANAIIASGEERYSSSSPLAFARGFLLERVGSYDLAVAVYRESISRDAKFTRASVALAGALSKLGKFEEAEAALKVVSSEQKTLAQIYVQTARFDRAKLILTKLPQTDTEVAYLNAIIALREYRADDAVKAIDAALKLSPNNAQLKTMLTEIPDVRRLGAPKLTGDALYQFRLGQALLGAIDSDKSPEALSALSRAVKLSPTNIHALMYRGFALLRTANADDARDAFVDLAKIVPNNAVVQTYLAVAELGRGRFDLALEAINKAIVLDKTYARAYFVLGNIYYQQFSLFGTSSDVVAAKDAFARCVTADPNFKVLTERFQAQLAAIK